MLLVIKGTPPTFIPVEWTNVSPSTVNCPVTTTSSSRVVVPPAESIVKFPEAVSISLFPETPIRMLLIFAPPFASIAPVNVDAPRTDKASLNIVAPVTPNVQPTAVFPEEDATVNLLLISKSPSILVDPLKVVVPVTSKSLNVVAPVTVNVSPTVARPVTARSSPTLKSSPI